MASRFAAIAVLRRAQRARIYNEIRWMSGISKREYLEVDRKDAARQTLGGRLWPTQTLPALTPTMFDHYLTPSQNEIARYWRLADAQMRHSPAQPFKASPAATAPAIRLAESGAQQLVAARWGLIPMWWKEQKPPTDAFVAPSEEEG